MKTYPCELWLEVIKLTKREKIMTISSKEKYLSENNRG